MHCTRRNDEGSRAPTGLSLSLWLGLWLAVLPGSRAAAIDICGCEGSPESFGDFETSDPSTWPAGTVDTGGCPYYIGLPLPEDGVLVFDSVNVSNAPNGCDGYVYFVRHPANPPVTLLVKGNLFVDTNDAIIANGGSGGNGGSTVAGTGGIPGPGGFGGGDAAYLSINLETIGGDGLGPGGGSGGTPGVAPGGGSFVGAPELRPLVGGGGGGGGFSSSTGNCSAGGGGGGGGAILIAANGSISFGANGHVQAIGGNGGSYSNGSCASGGSGGSGGAIRLVATSISGNGRLYAYGGSAGPAANAGAAGRIRMEAITNTFGTQTNPAAQRIPAPAPLVNPVQPAVAITAVDGNPSPEFPGGYKGEVDLIVDAPGPIQIDLETRDVPSGTNVEVTVKPKLGAAPLSETATLDPAACSGGVCTSDVVVNLLPGAYIVEARATFEAP